MQTFNPRNLTFLTWRFIYLNVKEASWPIALRFRDNQIIITREETWDFLLVTVGASFMGNILYRGSADQLMCRCKNKMVDLRSREVYKCCTSALIRSWLNYTDYICYSFHSLLENNMAHVTVDWNPLGKVFYR